MNQGKVIPRNVTLYESDLVTLRQLEQDKGLASLSAALRYLIHDWKHMKLQQPSITAESRAQPERHDRGRR